MKRYPTAVERERAKLEGRDEHPADQLRDPLAAHLAEDHDKRDEKKPRLKHLGGSDSDAFNIAIMEATRQTAWITREAEDRAAESFVSKALAGIAPTDEIEGMIGAQLVATHLASMECYRRAMIPDQTIEGRNQNLKHGSKASQTCAALLDALGRHRGKGQQKVVVEHVHRHVHVHGDGQVIDHADPNGGPGGGHIENKGQPHEQRAISHAPQPALWSEDQKRDGVPLPGDAEQEPLPTAWRDEPGRSEG